ncbi:MAG: serine hydrolase [Actinobacteria bacterium]|uniref:Unannotated protein n=1 Tax=freshwater metagenome TaxID=449393 RepID=A0A6J7RYA7_9ZZZZ|nr:serine hydrolase [Actinomycetota bacterium]
MKRKTTVWLGIFSVLLLVVAGATVFVVQGQYPEQLQLASGFKAKTLCAGIFIQGLEQSRLETEDAGFHFLFPFLNATVDTEKQKVTCSLWGTGLFSATAIRLPGLGAVLLQGESEANLRSGLKSPVMASESTDLPVSETPIAGVAEAVGQTFIETDTKNPKRTRAVLVLVGGKIVAERYAEGITANTRLLSWSMAKTFTNALTGILVGQGRLEVKQPAPVPEWSKGGDSRAPITVDQLLRMSSGLSFFEDYTDHPISDVNQMLFLESDMGAFAARQPLAVTPDTAWNYSSGSINLVSRVIRKSFGGDEAYWAFPYRALFTPLGMASAEWGVDTSGTYIGSSYIYATARDYARFGLLFLHDGVVNGVRLLPEGWVKYSTTPTTTQGDGTYGASVWLNAKQKDYPEVPSDLSYADGHNGQEIFFCPSLDLVAVRLGMTWKGDWGSKEFLNSLTKALKK